jgi:dipeptidyl aminopeptidase/acylaminoacyl peptidase
VDGELEDSHDIYVVSASSGAVSHINGFPAWKPKAQLAAPIWDAKGRSIYTVTEDAIWKASPDGGPPSALAGVPGHYILRLIAEDNGRLWTIDGGRSAAVVANDEGARQDGIYKIDLATGQVTRLLENGQRYWDLLVDGYLKAAPDGRSFLYTSQDAAHPIDLWIADEAFNNPRRLTHINPQYDRYELGTTTFIHWLGLDGQPLHGVLLLPPGYEKGRRYPMIVFVYGGISTQYNDFGFINHAPMNALLLATRGFVVFMPDAPQHLGTPMLDLAKTVLPGINKVVELGIADPKRLGLIGHSYGGYSVLSLLVQTPRFAAAVASAGTGDLISAYGQMNAQGAAFQTSIAEHGQGLMGTTPWEARERYVENSPFFYLDRIETPLLIAHGSADTTVASFLSDETFVGMRRLGKETRYLKYSGEGHSPLSWTYANRLDFCSRVIAWFERYLK